MAMQVEQGRGGAAMVGMAATEACTLLVHGYPVDIDGLTHRVFPSHAEVARRLGVPTSTVTRWARRTDVRAARSEVLARDRPGTAVPRPTIEALVAVVVRLAEARLSAHRPVSTRDRMRLERLLRWLVDGAHGTPATLATTHRLLVSLRAPRTAR